VTLRFVLDPELTPDLRDRIVTLWTEVTNAGGAVGLVAPVDLEQVRAFAAPTFDGIVSGPDRLLLGYRNDQPTAALIFSDNRFALKAHWRVLKRVMVHPDAQGLGYGTALLREAERLGRQLGWAALHVTVRGGHRLEEFYLRCGYREVGRLPGALRVGPGDDREEILMWLDLDQPPAEAGPGG